MIPVPTPNEAPIEALVAIKTQLSTQNINFTGRVREAQNYTRVNKHITSQRETKLFADNVAFI